MCLWWCKAVHVHVHPFESIRYRYVTRIAPRPNHKLHRIHLTLTLLLMLSIHHMEGHLSIN